MNASNLAKIEIPSKIIVRKLAEKMKRPVTDVIAQLMKNGVMSSLNEWVDFETAAIIAPDLGFEAVLKETEEQTAKDLSVAEPEEKLVPRPPVVVVMGHVDHGKTKLLDAIRQTNVVDQEAGGITQHIGAYQVTERNRLITFIDTPGHEAFSNMRSRGARVADLAILVVAADDGVKPQTVEAINIIQKSQIPMVVAINKIDLAGADPQKVKQELAKHNVLVEGWGGQVPVVELSAKQKIGVTELLDVILLVADLNAQSLLANPGRKAIGTVIESHIDKGRGPVATVVIQTGTLRQNGLITVGGTIGGKVRVMRDHRGKTIDRALPSQPVEIIGLKTASKVGDIITVIDEEELAKIRKLKSYRPTTPMVHLKKKEVELKKEKAEPTPKIKKLTLILKADTLGSLEAIIDSFAKIKSDEVTVEVAAKGLGNITEADVLHATASGARLYGFHVAITPQAQEVAKGQSFTIQTFTIIYNLINAVIAELENLLVPEVTRTTTGELKVLAVFRTKLPIVIAGGKVLSGRFAAGDIVSLLRHKQEIATGRVEQVQIDKQNVSEAFSGRECGLKLRLNTAPDVGDTILAFREEVRQKKLILS